jgi:hypothetical protein
MEPEHWLAVGLFVLGMLVGAVLALAARHPRISEFRAHEAEIRRRNAELEARIKGGCRQRLPEGR